MNQELLLILEALDMLTKRVNALVAQEAPAIPVGGPPTDEEISMNVSGTPDLNIRNPEQFAKMAPHYDPEKEPFSADDWQRMGMLKVDTRGYKPVVIDGVEYDRMDPQALPGDFHWIIRGVVDVTDKIWLIPIGTKRAQAFSPEAYERLRNYEGGLNDTTLSRWPRQYRNAYQETH